MVPETLEREFELVVDLVPGAPRQGDYARLGETFDPRRHVYPITEDVSVFGDRSTSRNRSQHDEEAYHEVRSQVGCHPAISSCRDEDAKMEALDLRAQLQDAKERITLTKAPFEQLTIAKGRLKTVNTNLTKAEAALAAAKKTLEEKEDSVRTCKQQVDNIAIDV